jgi:toxin ParE1/3/4
MIRYRVEVTEAACRDLASVQARIARDSPSAATRWLRTARRHVLSLATMPERYEVMPEVGQWDLEFEYRHLIFGNYRAIYRVEGARVLVARVLHTARRLTPEMLQGDR